MCDFGQWSFWIFINLLMFRVLNFHNAFLFTAHSEVLKEMFGVAISGLEQGGNRSAI
jgi:hypothetical protein